MRVEVVTKQGDTIEGALQVSTAEEFEEFLSRMMADEDTTVLGFTNSDGKGFYIPKDNVAYYKVY